MLDILFAWIVFLLLVGLLYWMILPTKRQSGYDWAKQGIATGTFTVGQIRNVSVYLDSEFWEGVQDYLEEIE